MTTETNTMLERIKEHAICHRGPCGHEARDHTEGGNVHCTGRTHSGKLCACRAEPEGAVSGFWIYWRKLILGEASDYDVKQIAKVLGLPESEAEMYCRPSAAGGRQWLFRTDQVAEAWLAYVDEFGFRRDSRADKILALAYEFPTIWTAHQEGTLRFDKGWSAIELERWARTPSACDAARHAASFVLGVWSNNEQWGVWPEGDQGYGRRWFNAHHALAKWDDAHRSAFYQWGMNPWWA